MIPRGKVTDQNERNRLAIEIQRKVSRVILDDENRHIVAFKSVIIAKERDNLVVHLARDAIHGISIKSFTDITNWTIRGVREMISALFHGLNVSAAQ